MGLSLVNVSAIANDIAFIHQADSVMGDTIDGWMLGNVSRRLIEFEIAHLLMGLGQ